jgi:hypothetical protein
VFTAFQELNFKYQITNTKWFDKPFDRLTVLSKVEGLTTTLSQPVESLKVERVEGQITMTEIQNPNCLRGTNRLCISVWVCG